MEHTEYYLKIVEEFGEDKANEIFKNLEEYQYKANKWEENKKLLKGFDNMLQFNRNNLTDISLVGEYFNNKQSSYYSNSKGFLIFEDEKSRLPYETFIDYEEFQELSGRKLLDVAELFIYIDTSNKELMKKIEVTSTMKELEETVMSDVN